MSNIKQNTECVRRYHQQTKHRLERYANGPETLDWSMQPDPFRRYEGSKIITLPFSSQSLDVGYNDMYMPDNIVSKELGLSSVGTLLELSMGLSAWKEYQGDRWALRCNPSSGNLHPTEAYIVTGGLSDLVSGVYHYLSYEHSLEQRCIFNSNTSETNARENKPFLLLGLSSVLWREAWKYGERAYRYCQLDIGHAMAAIRYACALLGWNAQLLSNIEDNSLQQLLGINREDDYGPAEREHPDLILKIVTDEASADHINVEEIVKYSQNGNWSGKANVLDKRHLYDWPIIEEAAQAAYTVKNTAIQNWTPNNLPSPPLCKTQVPAKEIILKRRSAQRFDGITAIESDDFYRMLDMTIPRTGIPPWDILPWQPKIHLVIFVHRVNGLQPGLYVLLRNEQVLDSLKTAMTDKMEWLRVNDTPDHLMLYRLVKANAQKAAGTLSCHQHIASDSAFSLGMLSEFDAALETGPWEYKYLYWEAGMLGHVLYLEAEALELQGTGIGCYFDDAFHEMLGITDTRFQSVYHFTVGGALNDGRLRTIAPYAHLNRK